MAEDRRNARVRAGHNREHKLQPETAQEKPVAPRVTTKRRSEASTLGGLHRRNASKFIYTQGHRYYIIYHVKSNKT